jgi:hypothetical protein
MPSYPYFASSLPNDSQGGLAPTVTGSPGVGINSRRGSLPGTNVGGLHESIQVVQIELVGSRFFNIGNISRRNCDWNSLARRFRRVSSCSHNYSRGRCGVLRIRVGEAIGVVWPRLELFTEAASVGGLFRFLYHSRDGSYWHLADN